MLYISPPLRNPINSRAKNIITQAAFARDALSNQSELMAAMSWRRADETKPIIVSITKGIGSWSWFLGLKYRYLISRI
jgi:epoxyqueuosine reductase QueG